MFDLDANNFRITLKKLTEAKLPWYKKYVALAQLCRFAYVKFIQCLPDKLGPTPEDNMAMFITPKL